jgi:VWFA-related protein
MTKALDGRERARLCCWGAALALLLALHGAPPLFAAQGLADSQSPDRQFPLIPRSHEERERNYRAEHRIVLNAMVTNADGKPATDLKPEDFTVLDDRLPRPIESFRAAHGSSDRERVHVILVLDAVNNSSRMFGIERREVERYLNRNRGKLPYPFSLELLSAAGSSLVPSSRDAEALVAGLNHAAASTHAMDCGDEGGIAPQQYHSDVYSPPLNLGPLETVKQRETKADCLNRKFVLSVAALDKLARQQTDVPGRAIVIWLGEGWPLLLGPDFSPDTPARAENHFDYLADLSASLEQAQITLDAVSSPDLSRKAEPGAEKLASAATPPEGNVAHTSDFALPVLVRQTGGQVLAYGKDIGSEISAAMADAEAYYALSFDAPPAAGVGEFHTLEVKVNRPGLAVRASTAYFAQP